MFYSILKFIVSDKKIHRTFRTRTILFINKTYYRNFSFHHVPKLYIGFKPYVVNLQEPHARTNRRKVG